MWWPMEPYRALAFEKKEVCVVSPFRFPFRILVGLPCRLPFRICFVFLISSPFSAYKSLRSKQPVAHAGPNHCFNEAFSSNRHLLFLSVLASSLAPLFRTPFCITFGLPIASLFVSFCLLRFCSQSFEVKTASRPSRLSKQPVVHNG